MNLDEATKKGAVSFVAIGLLYGREKTIEHRMKTYPRSFREEAERVWLNMCEAARFVIGDISQLVRDPNVIGILDLLYMQFGGIAGTDQLLNRLCEIFSPHDSDKLLRAYTEALAADPDRAHKQERAGQILVRTEKDPAAAILRDFPLEPIVGPPPQLRSSRDYLSRGEITHMQTCPRCQTEKRVDAKTKNFRCACGFTSPYPFPASTTTSESRRA